MADVVKYLNELACTNNALQIIVFDDDSVEIHFKDGSSIQLSPCGSCYQYVRCSVESSIAPKVNQSFVRQRCCFATSETKPKVELAILWRNHFAHRPYLPPHFQYLYKEAVHLHQDITDYTWPSDFPAETENCKNEENNLNVSVSAKDDLAKLNVCKNSHFCEVEHLVKLSRSIDSVACLSSTVESDNQDSTLNTKTQTRKYIWLKHIFPVSSCPIYWRYPLSCALQAINSSHNEALQLINSSHAPQPIPIVCEKQFLHSWRMNSETNSTELSLPANDVAVKSFKVVWSNRVIYWIIKKCDKQAGKNVSMEIWLPDETIMESQASVNFYYAHMTFDDKLSEVKTKRFYSPTALPMDPHSKTVLLRAIRLQSYTEQLLKDNLASQRQNYCWLNDISGFGNLVIDNDENMLENLFEIAEIPGLGKFSVASSSVQVIFVDGTTLYMSLNQKQLNSLASSSNDLATVLCRILFANGNYMECIKLTQSDSHLSRYLKPACDWLLWLAKPKYKRIQSPFYSDTIFSQEKLDMIDLELEKINRFNHLVENNSLSTTGSKETSLNNTDGEQNASVESQHMYNISDEHSRPELSTPYEVSKVLANTNQAINDIDNLIKNLRS